MKLYHSEAALCEAFVARAREQGWEVYPETGFDLLLVATDRVQTRGTRPGDQIGVEAKVHCNIEVLFQAMPKDWGEAGPNFHAVLVPFATKEFASLCRRLNIVLFSASKDRTSYSTGRAVVEHRPGVDHLLSSIPETFRTYYDAPAWKPDTVIWTPAGVKSPSTISPWKVSSIKLILYIEEKGHCTLADFRQHKIDVTRWRNGGWIVATGVRDGKFMTYRLGTEADYRKHNPPPHIAYPEITAQLRKDREESKKKR